MYNRGKVRRKMTGADELKKYIKPSSSIIFLGAGLLAVAIWCGFNTTFPYLIAFIILGLLGGFLAYTGITSIRDVDRMIQMYTENGTIDQIVDEFQNARSFAKGNLCLGETYVFGKKKGKILSYEDITRVYQYVHKTNFIEDNRELRVDTRGNGTVSLCGLSLRGKSDDELKEIVTMMYLHNQQIRIGYK